MSAMGPDSILLGFIPDYLHVSISSPRCMDGATRDVFPRAAYKFLRFLKEEAPKTERGIIALPCPEVFCGHLPCP